MKTLCNIALILTALVVASQSAHAQSYVTPFIASTTTPPMSCGDDQGNPCGSWMYQSDFYDSYAEIDSDTCTDGTTPFPQTTNPSTGMAIVYNDEGCTAGVSTSMTVVMGSGGSLRVDKLDAKVSVTVYLTTVSGEEEVDCYGSILVDNTNNEIC